MTNYHIGPQTDHSEATICPERTIMMEKTT